MKFVALVSGGKDSIFATLQAIHNGHELVCCAHLAPETKPNEDANDQSEESYMYQTAGSEAVRLQVEECIGVPLYVREIKGKSCNTSLVYDTKNGNNNSNNDDNDEGIVQDEVEDLHTLLSQVLRHHPEICAVSSGAILSTYQRTRIENVCSRLGLTSLSYLWRMCCQRKLLDLILDHDDVDAGCTGEKGADRSSEIKTIGGAIEAVLVRTACPPGLLPHRHLNKSLRELRDNGTLDRLQQRYGMHPAGEGGEYETLVLDCPKLFKRGRLILEEVEIVCDHGEVGILKIKKCRAERKEGYEKLDSEPSSEDVQQHEVQVEEQKLQNATSELSTLSISQHHPNNIFQSMHLPNVRIMKGGLCHVSALLSPVAYHRNLEDSIEDSNSLESHAAVQEFLMILQMLRNILGRLSLDRTLRANSSSEARITSAASPQDVIYVHLYLSQISHFAKINLHYQKFFGTHLPPSRSCVGVGAHALPGGRRVMMDCMIQVGSGEYLRSGGNSSSASGTYVSDSGNSNVSVGNSTFLQKALQNHQHNLRKTLHVQSISYWAPVCIGPYSQANMLRSSLVFLAGMIGLTPQSMTLVHASPEAKNPKDWEIQLKQSWKNAAAVLDGLDDGGEIMGGNLQDCLGGLVYFSLDALKSSLSASERSTYESDQLENSTNLPWNLLWKSAESVSEEAISSNGGIFMGSVDGTSVENNSSDNADASLYDEDGVLYGGYEDEETWREMTGTTASSKPQNQDGTTTRVPLLMVCLPELPMHAQSEVELICASRRAASCLDVCTGPLSCSEVPCGSLNSHHLISNLDWGMIWDTGYDSSSLSMLESLHDKSNNENKCKVSPLIEISSVARSVGDGCASVSTVLARWKSNVGMPLSDSNNADHINFDMEDILNRMIDSSISNVNGTSSGGSTDGINDSSLFTVENVLNVRLYYRAASISNQSKQNTEMDIEVDFNDDGSMLRTLLHSVLLSKNRQYREKVSIGTIGNGSSLGPLNIPSYSVVPVLGIHLSADGPIGCTYREESHIPILAMQVILVDMIRMETEMWVRYNRQYTT